MAESASLGTCDECGENDENHTKIIVVRMGDNVNYTIPTFPVFEAKLTHIEYILGDYENGDVFDGFIRQETVGTNTITTNCTLQLCAGYKHAFFVPKDKFSRCVDVDGINIRTPFDEDLFVMWQWTVLGDSQSKYALQYENTSTCSDNDPQSDDNGTTATDGESQTLHSTVFKCIGSTKE